MDDRKSIQAHRTVQIPSYGYFYIYVYLVNFLYAASSLTSLLLHILRPSHLQHSPAAPDIYFIYFKTGSFAASSLTSLLPQILRPSHLQYGSASTGFFHLLMYVVFQLYYYGRERKLNFRIPAALGLE